MKPKITSGFFFLLLMYMGLSQSLAQYYNNTSAFSKANTVWYFGAGAGLNFSSGSAVPFQQFSIVGDGLGGSSVADPLNGSLLFSTNAMNCYNRNDQIMPNGHSLTGIIGQAFGLFATQFGDTVGAGYRNNSLIVPVIDSPGKYYLFIARSLRTGLENSIFKFWDTASLFYSVVDMSLDNGLGDIVTGQKNILLNQIDSLTGNMIAIPGDNCDIWLLTHAYNYPKFIAYHITSQGINPNPIISTTGSLQGEVPYPDDPSGFQAAYGYSDMKVSPDRKHIAITSRLDNFWHDEIYYPGLEGLLLCEFDPSTGIVSDAIQFDTSLHHPWSVAFSPDNSKLYSSDYSRHYGNGGWGPGLAYLYQYDISSNNINTIAASKITIDTVPPFHGLNFLGPYLRLFNDKIYLASEGWGWGTGALTVVKKPDLPGLLCQYDDVPMSLIPGTDVMRYLTTEVVYPFSKTNYSIKDTVICGISGTFSPTDLIAPPGYMDYKWDNGSSSNVRLIYGPRTYWVSYNNNCQKFIDTFIVHPSNLQFSLGVDKEICKDSAISLSIYIPGASYLWQDGNKDSVYTIKEPGMYWVRIITPEGCTASDTIELKAKNLESFLGDDIELCTGDPIQHFIKVSLNQGAEILWSNGSHNPNLMISDTGTYWAILSDPPCLVSDTIRVSALLSCNCFIFCPSAFSPNGDGINDMFQPLVDAQCPISNYILKIYNRFGQLIFSSNTIQKGWDGIHNGFRAESGSYFYEIHFEGGAYKKQYNRKGDITLLN